MAVECDAIQIDEFDQPMRGTLHLNSLQSLALLAPDLNAANLLYMYLGMTGSKNLAKARKRGQLISL